MTLPLSFYILDPPSAHLCLEVEKHTLEKIPSPKGKTFLLALSGGADSTAMAYIFTLLAVRNNFNLYGIYINHHIRPEAFEERLFVENLCSKLYMPFISDEFNAPAMAEAYQIGLEEAARKGRYYILEAYRRKVGADYILLAHHLGDLSEDILMRLIRGVGWPALGGMRGKNGHIFRPLLHISRNKLLNFLNFLNQDWREDLSNQDQSFRRNRVRANFIPILKKENPSIERSFNNLHKLSLADEEFWENYLQEILDKHPLVSTYNELGQGLQLSIEAVLNAPLSVRLRLYYTVIQKLNSYFPEYPRVQPQFEKLLALDSAVMARRSGKIFQFQGGLVAQLLKTNISFILQKKKV